MNDKKSWSLFIISLFSLGYGVVAYGSIRKFGAPWYLELEKVAQDHIKKNKYI